MNSDDTVIYRDVHTLILSTITIDYGRHDENIWSIYYIVLFIYVCEKATNVGLPLTP